MQKTYLFSLQIGMPPDTVLFLTIGKPDIYKIKSLCKSATVFLPVLPIITEKGCRLT
jgi:hypothetical protein